MRIISLLLLALSSVAAADLQRLRFNGTGLLTTLDSTSITTFQKTLTSGTTGGSAGGFTAFLTVGLRPESIRKEDQTIFAYKSNNNAAPSTLRISLLDVQDKSFYIHFQYLYGNDTYTELLSSQKTFTTPIVGKTLKIMTSFTPQTTSGNGILRFAVDGAQYESTALTSLTTFETLKVNQGTGELRFGGLYYNSTSDHVINPFYGQLDTVSFHSGLFNAAQSLSLSNNRGDIVNPTSWLSLTSSCNSCPNDYGLSGTVQGYRAAPRGGYIQFNQTNNVALDRNTGIFSFRGYAYTELDKTLKQNITAISYGCAAPINGRLGQSDIASDFACPVPTSAATTSPTNAATTSPTGAATSSPTGAATSSPTGAATTSPTGAATSSPTDAATSAPSDAATTSPTGAATSAPSNAATSSPSSAATTSPTGAATSAPSDAATTSPTGAATSSPSSSATSAPSDAATTTSPTDAATSAPSSAATSAPSDAATTSAPSDAATTSAPSSSATTSPTENPNPNPTNTPTDATTTVAPTTASPSTDAPSTASPTTDTPTTATPTDATTQAPTDPSTTTDAPPTKDPLTADSSTGPSSTGPFRVNAAAVTAVSVFGAALTVIMAACL